MDNIQPEFSRWSPASKRFVRAVPTFMGVSVAPCQVVVLSDYSPHFFLKR
jgi:hypothetical protein